MVTAGVQLCSLFFSLSLEDHLYVVPSMHVGQRVNLCLWGVYAKVDRLCVIASSEKAYEFYAGDSASMNRY